MIYHNKPLLGQQPDWSLFPQPVGLWVMNEGSGNKTFDLSGNGIGGTFIGTAGWSPGEFGTSINIDGDSDYVDFGSTPTFDWDITSEATIIIWFNADSIADLEILFSRGKSVYPFSIRFFGVDDIKFISRTNINTNHLETTSNKITAGKPFCVACVFKNTTNGKRIYINGVLEAQGTHEGTLNLGGARLSFLGYTVDGTMGGYFDGRFNSLVIYNRALTAQQITQLYYNPFPWFQRDPIALWAGGAVEAVAAGHVPIQSLVGSPIGVFAETSDLTFLQGMPITGAF